jgi:S-adenosylmethionine-diacylgycerolhomoserine-N-methlytransferase
MSRSELAADARILWRLLRGQPDGASHAERLEGFYAVQATRYDAFRARLLHGRAELIQALEIPAGARVVELGAGTGSNLDALAQTCGLERLAQVQLVDLCPSLLAVARQRTRGLANVEVIAADAATWQPAQPVDRVFLAYSLTMMPDWRAVLANAQAMLAPGGRLGMVDFHLPASGGLANRFWRHWFAHDGVHLSAEHVPALRAMLAETHYAELRARVPYLPGLRAPYYLFVGQMPDKPCTRIATV